MSRVATPPSTRYVPSLDGIRALAVVAVVLYHLDFRVADGGFLGVEVFFVLSGYLITTLLLRERRERRSIGLQAFWGRRARRLLPAVVAMIAVVCGISALFHATNVHVRDDAIASLLYVENWWAIVDQRAYFEQFGQPSPFTHLWSLAIEEQFYLLWPLALAGALRYLNKAKAFALTLVLAGLSIWAMVQLTDITHVERAYYGTDTRAFGLLLGAAMAFVWKPGDRLRRPGTGRARRILDLLSVAALGGLVWQLAGRSEFDAWTFPWGLLWVDLLSLVLVAAAVAPRTVISRALGMRPLAAIGRRSYSLYLWHWPVIVLLRPGERPPVRRLADPRRLRRAHGCADRGVVPLRRAALPDRTARTRAPRALRGRVAVAPPGGQGLRRSLGPGRRRRRGGRPDRAVDDRRLPHRTRLEVAAHRRNGLAHDGDHVGLGHHEPAGDRADAGQRRAGHHRSPVHRHDRPSRPHQHGPGERDR